VQGIRLCGQGTRNALPHFSRVALQYSIPNSSETQASRDARESETSPRDVLFSALPYEFAHRVVLVDVRAASGKCSTAPPAATELPHYTRRGRPFDLLSIWGANILFERGKDQLTVRRSHPATIARYTGLACSEHGSGSRCLYCQATCCQPGNPSCCSRRATVCPSLSATGGHLCIACGESSAIATEARASPEREDISCYSRLNLVRERAT
jgi:hypothetical protein